MQTKGVNFEAYTMKSTFGYIPLLLFAFCLVQIPARGQDAPDFEPATNGYEEKADHEGTLELNADPETKNVNPKAHVPRDSSAIRNVQRNKPVEPVREGKQPGSSPEDDSILSFNFIYYIIQKFKLQDIIE